MSSYDNKLKEYSEILFSTEQDRSWWLSKEVRFSNEEERSEALADGTLVEIEYPSKLYALTPDLRQDSNMRLLRPEVNRLLIYIYTRST